MLDASPVAEGVVDDTAGRISGFVGGHLSEEPGHRKVTAPGRKFETAFGPAAIWRRCIVPSRTKGRAGTGRQSIFESRFGEFEPPAPARYAAGIAA